MYTPGHLDQQEHSRHIRTPLVNPNCGNERQAKGGRHGEQCGFTESVPKVLCVWGGPGLTVMSPEGLMEPEPQGHVFPAQPPGGRRPVLWTECVCLPDSWDDTVTPTSWCQEVGPLGGDEAVRVQPSRWNYCPCKETQRAPSPLRAFQVRMQEKMTLLAP